MNIIGIGKDTQFNVMMNVLFTVLAVGLVIAVLICIIIVAFFALRRYALKNLEYRRYFSEKKAFQGQGVYLVEEFTNHSFLPMFKMDVETHITTKLNIPKCRSGNEINQEFISRFFVMPFTKIKRKHRIECLERGYYRLESAKLRFMKIEVYLDSIAEIIVYPKELEIRDIDRINRCMHMNLASNRPLVRDPFSFARVREYITGDSMNAINHKATAKMGKLMVNHSEFVIGRRLKIYINFQPGDTGIPIDEFGSMLERAIEYGAYIVGEAFRNNWKIGITANCKMQDGSYSMSFGVESGEGHYLEIMEALACARVAYGYSIGRVMDDDLDARINDTEIFFFTSYLDKSISSRLQIFESLGNTVNIVDLKEVAVYDRNQ